MEEILHQWISRLSHYLKGFIHPRWCRISFINNIIPEYQSTTNHLDRTISPGDWLQVPSMVSDHFLSFPRVILSEDYAKSKHFAPFPIVAVHPPYNPTSLATSWLRIWYPNLEDGVPKIPDTFPPTQKDIQHSRLNIKIMDFKQLGCQNHFAKHPSCRKWTKPIAHLLQALKRPESPRRSHPVTCNWSRQFHPMPMHFRLLPSFKYLGHLILQYNCSNYCILLSILNPMVPPTQANFVSKASGTKSSAPSVRFAKGGRTNFTAKTMDDPGMAVGYACFQGLRKAGIQKTQTHQNLQLLPILRLYWLLLFTP